MDRSLPQTLAGALVAALTLAAAPAAAQVQVVEESQAEARIVERGEIRQGRGTQLGMYLVSPIYVTPLREDTEGSLSVFHPGFGLGLRGGWEFPSGLALEVFAEVAIHGVTGNPDDLSPLLLQGGVGGTVRYLFFNPSALVPFVQASGALRGLGFDWPDGTSSQGITLDVGGGVGAQIELSKELGLELGVLAAAMIPGSYFSDAIFVLYPFAGVTLYTDSED